MLDKNGVTGWPRSPREFGRAMRRWFRMHPRIGLAVRVSIAGGLAWLAAQTLPTSEAGRYAYFAPMGAVIVTSVSVGGTVRELVRSVAALLLGAGVGLTRSVPVGRVGLTCTDLSPPAIRGAPA